MVYSDITGEQDDATSCESHPKNNKLQARHKLSSQRLISHPKSILLCGNRCVIILRLICILFASCEIAKISLASRLWSSSTSNNNDNNNVDDDYNQATQTFSSNRPPSSSRLKNDNLYDDNGDNKWVRDQNDVDSNEISDINQSFNQNNNKPIGKDYACGRAVAMERQRNHYRDYQTSRNKYRPFEIRMPRIIGGDETELGEFPWIASIKLNGQPICGGSLIDKSWVLTAAHCVVGYNPKNLTVRLGSYRIKDMTEVQSLELPVNMFIVHKDYSVPRPFSNDIALLKLSHYVRFTDYIIPVCLPYEDQVFGMGNQMGSIGGSVTTNIEDFRNQILNNFGYDAMDATTPGAAASAQSLGSESGIVVSTKMSDMDIAMCFNKLEQNYLASIGISPTPMASNDQYQPAAAPVNEQPSRYRPGHLTAAPPQSHPQTIATTARPTTAPHPQHAMINTETNENNENNIFSYHDVFNSILIPIEGDKKKITLLSPANYAIDQDFSNDLSSSSSKLNQQSDYFSWTSNNHMNGKLLRQNQKQERPIQASALGGRQMDLAKSTPTHIGAVSGNEAKSYHRLPISNELIKEIHEASSSNSIGPFASIGQTDIAAMASDLIHSTSQQQQQSQKNNAISHSSGSIIQAASPLNHDGNHDHNENILNDNLDHHSPSFASSPSSSASIHSNYREKVTISVGGSSYVPSHENGNNGHNNNKLNSNNNNNNHLVDLGDGEGPSMGGGGLSNDQMMDLNGIANNQLTSSAIDDPTRYAGLNGIVVGWGWIKELEADDANNTKGTPSVTLQKVRLPVLRNKVCESWFQSQSKKITLLPSQFCAGFQGGGKDACRGDSGGPMIIEDSTDTGRYKLIGIVSAGIGCARPSLPGLYTRVASFLPWINAQINRY